MGAPIYIINHTRKEYIASDQSRLDTEHLQILLPFYVKLLEERQWRPSDNIVFENVVVISGSNGETTWKLDIDLEDENEFKDYEQIIHLG